MTYLVGKQWKWHRWPWKSGVPWERTAELFSSGELSRAQAVHRVLITCSSTNSSSENGFSSSFGGETGPPVTRAFSLNLSQLKWMFILFTEATGMVLGYWALHGGYLQTKLSYAPISSFKKNSRISNKSIYPQGVQIKDYELYLMTLLVSVLRLYPRRMQ